MRIHVTYKGKNTTISVDDVLIDYLGAWLREGQPEFHSKADKQFNAAVERVRKYVWIIERIPSEGTLSSQVQKMIIEEIAKPGLDEIIKARGPLPKKQRKPDGPPADLSNDPVAMAWLKASDPSTKADRR